MLPKHKLATLQTLLLLLLLTSFATLPLWRGAPPWQGDGELHLYRLAQLSNHASLTTPYPRWLPDLGYGYGFPLFHYYAPLSYYLLLPFTALGLDPTTTIRLGYTLALLALATATYLWSRELHPPSAPLAPLLTLYAPYTLFNLYGRGAYAEIWGLACLAWTLYAWHRWHHTPQRRYLTLFTLSYTALILTHNITALIGTPFLLGYALFLWLKDKQHPPLWLLGLPLLLSAFFWLPALADRDLVQIDRLINAANFDYRQNFLSLAQLLSPPQTAHPTQANPAFTYPLGWLPLLLALSSWLPTPHQDRNYRLYRAALTLATLIAITLTLPLSQPLWDTLPLLEFVQFPWRFLGLITICLSLLATLSLSRWLPAHPNRQQQLILTTLTLTLLLYALPQLFPPTRAQPLPTTIDRPTTIQFEQQSGWLGTTAAADYLPTTVTTLPTTPATTILPPDTLTTDQLRHQTETAHNYTLTYQTSQPLTTTLNLFAFPTWHATLDQQPHPLTITDPHGLIQTTLPAGQHTLTINWQPTPAQTTGRALTLLGLLLCLFTLYRYQPPPAPSPTTHNPLSLWWPIIPLFILLPLLKINYLDHHNTIFRQNPIPSTPPIANFNNQLQLYPPLIDTTTLSAGSPLTITLPWQTSAPLTAEHSIALHLLDQDQNLFAQADHQHPGGIPLPRWPANGHLFDTHTLTIPVTAPPGTYQLITYVYHPQTNQRLPLLNQDGLPLGHQHPLTTLTITPANPPPPPSTINPPQRPNVNLGPLHLLGHTPLPTTAQVGDTLPLRLWWQIDAPLTT
ncbi:MAG TPA: 6-pyruvoyl-tetrahydropterin synthase-related protein, partial [Anaerolineae bacterium]|nr:6-pyruvoyl-tetrahydropterin synthase-related protein [Anaerolineae bacterium]